MCVKTHHIRNPPEWNTFLDTDFKGHSNFNYEVDNKGINAYKNGWFEYFEANLPEMNKALNEGGKLSDEDMATLRAKLEDYGKTLG